MIRCMRSSALVVLTAIAALFLSAQDTKYPPQGQQIPGPNQGGDYGLASSSARVTRNEE